MKCAVCFFREAQRHYVMSVRVNEETVIQAEDEICLTCYHKLVRVRRERLKFAKRHAALYNFNQFLNEL